MFIGSPRGGAPAKENSRIQFERLLKDGMPKATAELFLSIIQSSPYFENLQEEWFHNDDYMKPYRHLPHPPIFQTGDPVVYQSGHVLLIKRGGYPGKGLYALPGGFLQNNETVIQCIYRELKEETRIKVPPAKLIKSLVMTERFDHPLRSVRKRTITEAGLFLLDDGHDLPQVKADDDAAEALWMPLSETHENEHLFFDDHFFIIHKMIRSYGRKDENQRNLMAALAASAEGRL